MRCRGIVRALALFFLAAAAAPAGWQSGEQREQQRESSPVVLRATTQLVLVDVVATDRSGKPVTGLTAEDFELLEDGKPHEIATFGYESRSVSEPFQMPLLPENIYTNRPEYVAPPGPPVVLLLDGLNSTTEDQAYARQQLLKYLATQLQAGQRTAVLALGTRLHLLQGFTSDPQLLRAAIERHTKGRLAEDIRTESHADLPEQAVAMLAEMAPQVLQSLERYAAERVAMTTDMRVATTLAALRAIARALGGLPGRKNLVWVSATFPLLLTPNPAADSTIFRSYADELRRTATMLADAQVAVYPVDARGLVNYAMTEASEAARLYRGMPGGPTADSRLAQRDDHLLSSQQTMGLIADQTGGRAFTNRNDIDAAVGLALADGSSYYVLGYYPTNRKWDGKFRKVEVRLRRPGVELRHRQGYYAVDPQRMGPRGKERELELAGAIADPLPASVVSFRAHVPPVEPRAKAAVVVQFLVDAETVTFQTAEEGKRSFNVDFLVAAVAPDSTVAAKDNHTVSATLQPDIYQRVLRNGLPYEMKLSVPAGRYQLRLIVRDNPTGWLGALDVPLVIEAPR
jgi:VWFA-related protein